MKHPTDEQWMSYLYDEVRPDERASLSAHLRACTVCAGQIEEWRTAARDLDAWQLRPRGAESTARRRRHILLRRTIPWAAAALILLGAGFLFGRVASAPIDQQKLIAAIAPEIRQQLLQEFEMKRSDDNRAIHAAFEKLNAQRIADYVSLKKELDTVAVLTDAGLRDTEQQLAQFVDYSQSHSSPGASSKIIP